MKGDCVTGCGFDALAGAFTRERILPAQSRESSEITIGGTQDQPMLEGESGQMRIRNEVCLYAGRLDESADMVALFGYSASLRAQFRRAAEFADRILRGAKPADLPVEQVNIFELRINAKTAKVLGIAAPQSVLLRADRVIE